MKKIRESKVTKFLVYYFSINIITQIVAPTRVYALTSGPTQPEFNSFTPIGTSDMVDLASGNYNYNIPIMDVGGYPINLSYNSGVTMDQEASWVGLGWNLNVGQIQRQVRGLPDDFNGDEITYQNDLKDNVTVGSHFNFTMNLFGVDNTPIPYRPSFGLGVQYNNYEGITFKPSYGISSSLGENVSVGLNFSSSVGEGTNVSPSVNISSKKNNLEKNTITSTNTNASLGLGFNSRKGVENLNLSASISRKSLTFTPNAFSPIGLAFSSKDLGSSTASGSISFNNQSFTPSKRIGFDNNNFTFNAGFGAEIFGIEGQLQISGYGSTQKISSYYRNHKEKAYGYENTQNKKNTGVLDFNRENESIVTENTIALPITNYTYDLYNIEGQGVSGMFRPYRSKVSYIYNDQVSDYGAGVSLGAEFGAGNLVHGGVDYKISPSTSTTGGWFTNNKTTEILNPNSNSTKWDYEPVSFKMVGSLIVDSDIEYYNKIHTNKAIRFNISGGYKNRELDNKYIDQNGVSHSLNNPIDRQKRFSRSQLVVKVSNKEAKNDPMIIKNDKSKEHHTAAIKVLQTDGTNYIYGETAYNTEKVEATFDVSGSSDGNNTTGLISYNGGTSGNHNNNSDKFLNKITTPAYAHSYLLTSILSSDYEDIDNNGPSINDLGSYTKFEYNTTNSNYQWRIPFEKDKATYNQGLLSKNNDQKGTYIYGKKQLKYLSKIITKTHVAFFDLEDRKDGIGVAGENGGKGFDKMQKIKSIRLYSIKEVMGTNGQINDPGINGSIKPIKTAHFIYDYSLCKGIPNNEVGQLSENEISNDGGKLTLKKVYFTYRNSNMGKYTPYKFNYNQNNPDYNMKGFDIWGNYKENSPISVNNTTEFPFVEQNKEKADQNSSSWNLANVQLPSGGTISIETESDDYQFVQNKKAMQMFEVVGAGNEATSNNYSNNTLYNDNNHCEYIYVKLPSGNNNITVNEFKNKFLEENINKYIQFRFYVKMANDFEYVSGYFQIEETASKPFNIIQNVSGNTIVAIPLKMLRRDGGTNANAKVNPIVKTAWGFGRMYLNREMYSLGGVTNNTNVKSIVEDLIGSISAITEIFKGPNKALQDKGRARLFNPKKSWVRLENSEGRKLGGGLRVKTIKLSDNWTVMTSENGGTTMEYGQEYSYDVNGKSSGVATYEPNGSSENALVEPMMLSGDQSYAEKIAAPAENNYLEKPFGENYFPSPQVTYSKVTVKNLDRIENNEVVVKKHATGKVVTEHYTSKDFPTKVKTTELAIVPELVKNDALGFLAQLANFRVRNHLTATQGFYIETNDMNGKVSKQAVYQQGNDNEPISLVEYKYNVDSNNNIDNNLTVIDNKGKVQKRAIGLDYDIINDFNQSKSTNEVAGFDGNLAAILYSIFPAFVPVVLPKYSYNENLLKTAVTTKHVHRTGIMVEKIAYDLGSKVSTKNLAWDAQSGEVVLTETINEYDDKYYSFNYPAYWMYENMGLASNNIGFDGKLERISSTYGNNNPYYKLSDLIQSQVDNDIRKIFKLGDELYCPEEGVIQSENNNPNPNILTETMNEKVWVVGYNSTNTGILLMNRQGQYINSCGNNGPNSFKFKITRSGLRNLTSASMASVTLMKNPIVITNSITGEGSIDQTMLSFSTSNTNNPRVINSSAVVYSDFWDSQIENKLPEYPSRGSNAILPDGNVNYPYKTNVNPYVYNIKGDWRAEKSYAYLAGRKSADGEINNPRNEGFYTSFNPFYVLDPNTNNWIIDESNWTYASSITKYSPFGVELENKDALNRYSAAQYGYNYTLPMAVASNSKYESMGFEGFEETPKDDGSQKHFSFNNTKNNLSGNHSHTGRKSIKTTPSQSVKLQRTKNGVYTPNQVNCPITNCSINNVFVSGNLPLGEQCLSSDPDDAQCVYVVVELESITNPVKVTFPKTMFGTNSMTIQYNHPTCGCISVTANYGPINGSDASQNGYYSISSTTAVFCQN